MYKSDGRMSGIFIIQNSTPHLSLTETEVVNIIYALFDDFKRGCITKDLGIILIYIQTEQYKDSADKYFEIRPHVKITNIATDLYE